MTFDLWTPEETVSGQAWRGLEMKEKSGKMGPPA